MVGAAIGIEGEDAVYFFLSVAVLGEETACETAIDDFYLRAQDIGIREEWLHPVVDAGTDDKHLGSLGLCLLERSDALWPQQMTIVVGKVLTEGIEGFQVDAFKEIGEDALLGLPVRIEVEFHQHQQMGMTQETKRKGLGATGIADKLQEGVSRCQRSIEIKSMNLSHSLGEGIRSIICFTAQESAIVTTT